MDNIFSLFNIVVVMKYNEGLARINHCMSSKNNLSFVQNKNISNIFAMHRIYKTNYD